MSQNREDFITTLLIEGQKSLEDRLPKNADNFEIVSNINGKIQYKYYDKNLEQDNIGKILVSLY